MADISKTVLVAALGYCLLPNGVDSASFLSKEERESAVERLSSTKVGSAGMFFFSILSPSFPLFQFLFIEFC